MPFYMIQTSYTPEAWAGMVKRPQDRARASRAVIKNLKGRLVSFYYAFGENDVVLIAELPNNEAAAAAAMAAAAGGALKSVQTTVLMTVQEAMSGMRKAKQAGYEPPK